MKSVSHRPTSIKTRIETELVHSQSHLDYLTHRPTSIKTRIETDICLSMNLYLMTHRPTSIKTRIETAFRLFRTFLSFPLTDQLPLKQGLKLLTQKLG